MADKETETKETSPPNRGGIGLGNIIAALLACITIYYAALPLSTIVSEVERVLTGPRPGDAGAVSVFYLGFILVSEIFLIGILISFAVPANVSIDVMFWTHMPVLGTHVYQIYSRSRLIVLSYLSDMCYRTMKTSRDDVLVTVVCRGMLSQSGESGSPARIPWRPSFIELHLLSIYQVFILIVGIMLVVFRYDGMNKEPSKLKSESPSNGATVSDLKLKPVVAVKTITTMASVIDLLCEKGFEKSFEPIPVVSDDSEKLVGLVTLGNLLTHILRGRGTVDTPVSQVMTDWGQLSSIVAPTITVDTPLSDLGAILEHKSAAVVTESISDGVKAVHVVTKLDLLSYLASQTTVKDTQTPQAK